MPSKCRAPKFEMLPTSLLKGYSCRRHLRALKLSRINVIEIVSWTYVMFRKACQLKKFLLVNSLQPGSEGQKHSQPRTLSLLFANKMTSSANHAK